MIQARKAGIKTIIIACAAVMLLLASAGTAQALETERWTAKANQIGGSGVLAGTETRVTFQGQLDEGESLSSLTLELPEGSVIPLDEVSVTAFEDLDRADVTADVVAEGDHGITVNFSDGVPAGALIMVEINNMKFPEGAGSYDLVGSYTNSAGDTADLGAAEYPIEVEVPTPVEQFSTWLGEQGWVQAWNSNKFLHLFLDPQIAIVSIPVVFGGWLLSLGLVAISFPLAMPLGLILAFMRISRNKILRGLGGLYINIVRGTPLFLQIYIAFFGLPLLGISLDNFMLGIIVLMMNSGAYLAEIFRAGIQSISSGQYEAARSLGMTRIQSMKSVILPQMALRVIPTTTSEFILMYKDTSLLAAVGVMEVMMFSKTITAATGNVTPYIVAAAFYLIVTLPATKIINKLEKHIDDRLNGRLKKKSKTVSPKEAVA